ncbi:hypothetical protein K490DRAFT_23249, partial [Saccharata proteae CBS 121410]
PRPRRPNYAQIHARPLPVAVYPLPAFIPHNPLSLLRIAYAIISQSWSSPPSHRPIVGYFDVQTRSVHVTDTQSIRDLWEQGFFGKGSLSRSEPTWLAREKQRRGELRGQVLAEDYTQVRRNERREFKNERARKEREAIEEQLRLEGKLKDDLAASANAENGTAVSNPQDGQAQSEPSVASADAKPTGNGRVELVDELTSSLSSAETKAEVALAEEEAVEDEEHLQLTLEEAFFLVYGLGALTVYDRETNTPIGPLALFRLCRIHSYFPARPLSTATDDAFLIRYVAYHHFRSRGWVVRPGAKFSADYMIYNRGPVFSHAEFAVHIIPSYRDGRQQRTEMDWWWYHCVNRVQTQVLKTLVLVYVEIPTEQEVAEVDEHDIGALLKKFKVREFAMKRWVANRSR